MIGTGKIATATANGKTSPSAFPVLPRSRESRRESTATDRATQGQQDSNLQPPALENCPTPLQMNTGAAFWRRSCPATSSEVRLGRYLAQYQGRAISGAAVDVYSSFGADD